MLSVLWYIDFKKKCDIKSLKKRCCLLTVWVEFILFDIIEFWNNFIIESVFNAKWYFCFSCWRNHNVLLFMDVYLSVLLNNFVENIDIVVCEWVLFCPIIMLEELANVCKNLKKHLQKGKKILLGEAVRRLP